MCEPLLEIQSLKEKGKDSVCDTFPQSLYCSMYQHLLQISYHLKHSTYWVYKYLQQLHQNIIASRQQLLTLSVPPNCSTFLTFNPLSVNVKNLITIRGVILYFCQAKFEQELKTISTLRRINWIVLPGSKGQDLSLKRDTIFLFIKCTVARKYMNSLEATGFLQ